MEVELFLQLVHLLSDVLDIQHLQNQMTFVPEKLDRYWRFNVLTEEKSTKSTEQLSPDNFYATEKIG
ncbi:hypothetical protein EYF80_006801 [Liparis tanakae]|uniref:Uncharacterized protein n=1 Tax=Liparis tanakae TaxID=230148 RepID=A0A4Z2IZ67_9TELE|nr:hypothetical protein EYF80_006801 [Liparis tanakae]